MITAGIDMGSKNIKVVILKDGHILSQSMALAGLEQTETAEQVFNEALRQAQLSKGDVAHITATGVGRKIPTFAHDDVTEVGADAKGADFLFPSVRTVIDVGAEEGRGIKCNSGGKVIDFAINEKCAAGSGAFTEAMARALEVDLEEFGKLSLKSTKSIPMNAQCAIFAESEVVSLVHARTPKEDISRAVHDAIAERITSMVRRVGIEKDIALIGGMARNVGFVDALKRSLKADLLIPEAPEFVTALGAAVMAAGQNQ